MKKAKLLLMVIVMITNYALMAQIAINTDGSTPNSSAILDIKSNDKGLLIPRMTQAEISIVENPADGLTIYSTDDNCFYFYDGNANRWKEIAIGSGSFIPGCGTITDSDNNTYNTVQIGLQCWMTKNLATTKYNNGSAIPLITDNTTWYNLSTPGYCWYNNDQTGYGDTYGGLYNWYAVNTGNLCPTGWHVPTDAEWATLVNYLGSESMAGGKLKETGTTHWSLPNTGATNETGFTALPAGYRYVTGAFYHIYNYNYLYSATEAYSTGAWYRYMRHDNSLTSRNSTNKRNGFSVRCLKN